MVEDEIGKRPPSRMKVQNPDQIFALAQRGEDGIYTMGHAFIGSLIESISINLLIAESRFQFSTLISYTPPEVRRGIGRGVGPVIITSPNGTKVAFLDHPEKNHLSIQTGEAHEEVKNLRFRGVELTRPVFDRTLEDFTFIVDGLLMMYVHQGIPITDITVSADSL